MSQVKTILQALVKLGVATYTDLEAETKLARNKLRWTCNSLKQDTHIKQTEEPITKEVAWKITPLGRQHLIKIAGEGIKAAPPLKTADRTGAEAPRARTEKSITPGMEKTKAAKVAKKSNGKLQTTPAEGGVNIIRSLESESLVEAASTSPEVQAVVEQQAPEASPAPASSDVKPAPPLTVKEWADQQINLKPIAQPFQKRLIAALKAFDEVEEPQEFTDPQLFAMVSIDGTLHIAFAGKEINLPAFAVRQLGEFLSDTEPAWA